MAVVFVNIVHLYVPTHVYNIWFGFGPKILKSASYHLSGSESGINIMFNYIRIIICTLGVILMFIDWHVRIIVKCLIIFIRRILIEMLEKISLYKILILSVYTLTAQIGTGQLLTFLYWYWYQLLIPSRNFPKGYIIMFEDTSRFIPNWYLADISHYWNIIG